MLEYIVKRLKGEIGNGKKVTETYLLTQKETFGNQ